jgi:hypothetical protein
VLHPYLAGAAAAALVGALVLAPEGYRWAAAAGLLGLAALQWRRPVPAAEARWVRRWLLPPALGAFAVPLVLAATGDRALGVAAGCALVAAVWLALYARGRPDTTA